MPETSTSQPIFAPASLQDEEALIALMRAFYAEEGLAYEDARARMALGALLADEALGRVFRLHHGDALAGYVVLTFGYSLEFAGRFALLDEIYLRPEVRGRGWGRAALAFVEAACRELGMAAIRLEVERHNGHARRLYGRAAYEAHDRDLMTRYLR